MTQEQEKQLERLLEGIDISDVLKVASERGNRYNRRILKFFRWFCKWVPVFIMCVHVYGMLEFARHPREMIIPIKGNTTCYMFIYLMVYIMPMVIILASRFFFLCWRYRIPFFLLFRCQRYTHRPRKRVHDQQHDNEPLYPVRHDITDICLCFQ